MHFIFPETDPCLIMFNNVYECTIGRGDIHTHGKFLSQSMSRDVGMGLLIPVRCVISVALPG